MWISFRIYGELKEQKRIIAQLRQDLKVADHYNYNFYAFPYGTLGHSHLAVRIGDSIVERNIEDILKKEGINYEKSEYGEQDEIAMAYELGSRCADLVAGFKDKNKVLHDRKYFIHFIHGLLNDLSPETEYFGESEIYASLLAKIPETLGKRIDQIREKWNLQPGE